MTRHILNPTFLFASLDFLLAVSAFFVASLLRFEFDVGVTERYLGPILPRAISFGLLVMLGLLAMGLYRARQRPRLWETIARAILGISAACVCYVILFYLFPYLQSGRGVLAGAFVASCVLVSVGRLVLLNFVDKNPIKTRVLVLGTGPHATKIGRLRRASDRRRFEIVGYAALSAEDYKQAEQSPELRPIISAENIADFPSIDEVVVALDERRGNLPIDMLLRFKGRGTPVTDIIDFLERETGRIDLDLLYPSWFVYTHASYTDAVFRVVKRIVDVILSTLVFVLTSPVFATVVALIWIEDGWRAPLLYRQRRVGLGGQDFELLKFRSMTVDAEAKTGPRWSVQNDSRVTSVGKVIRRFRIDELPQLLNIIRGEMSIVGPRPERPEFVQLLTAELPMFSVRHNMRPGLTGWAQLNFPYGASVVDAKEKLSYDIFYIKNASVTLDLLIFLQTIEVVVWGKAISMAGSPRPRNAKGEPNANDLKDSPVSTTTAKISTDGGTAAAHESTADADATPSRASSSGSRN